MEIDVTGIESEVCADIAARQKVGKAKYPQELADNHAPLSERLQHAYEETLDRGLYLKWAIKEAKEMEERILQLMLERDRARLLSDQVWLLRREFELVIGTPDIKEGVERVKAWKAAAGGRTQTENTKPSGGKDNHEQH